MRRRPRRQSPRFQHNDPLTLQPWFIEKREWNNRRFPGARWRGEYGMASIGQDTAQRRHRGVDWERHHNELHPHRHVPTVTIPCPREPAKNGNELSCERLLTTVMRQTGEYAKFLTVITIISNHTAPTMTTRTLRVALAHLAPIPGELAHNRHLVEAALIAAARAGAHWIVTPELIISGYTFADSIGTEWIVPQPDPWMTTLCQLAARLRMTVFLSHPEQDRRSKKLYNSVFVITPDGAIAGSHRKINTLRVGSESWSSPGKDAVPVPVHPVGNVGILICADAFSPRIAGSLKAQGANLLVSSAAWGPGLHGPNGEWERCTKDTGLPLMLCNRTGPDRTLDFTAAESVVVKDGQRLLSLSSKRSTIFIIDWNLRTQDLTTPQYQRIDL